jgi:hypothetical protein
LAGSGLRPSDKTMKPANLADVPTLSLSSDNVMLHS